MKQIKKKNWESVLSLMILHIVSHQDIIKVRHLSSMKCILQSNRYLNFLTLTSLSTLTITCLLITKNKKMITLKLLNRI